MDNIALLHVKLDLIAKATGAYQLEPIATIIKREFDRSDGQPVTVIDYYGPWNRAGTWPKMKLCHEYIDYEWQVRRFEQWTGLKFDELPVLHSSQALRRVYGKVYQHEVQVRPFRLMVYSPPSNDDSDSKKLIIAFVAARYRDDQPETVPESQPEPPAPPKLTPEPETAVSKASREFYESLGTVYEQTAYKSYKYDDFVAMVTGVVERWDEAQTKKALISVLGDAIMFPGQKNLSHGRQRVALANALRALASMIDDGTDQVSALQKAKEVYGHA